MQAGIVYIYVVAGVDKFRNEYCDTDKAKRKARR